MPDLLFHSQTKEQIDRYLAHPSHGLLITGAAGSGKASIAALLAAQVLGITPQKARESNAVVWIAPDEKGGISIEAVRKLQDFLRLRAPGKALFRRAIVIEEAGALTTEAQNALLKILEEPPEDTILILTCHDVSQLLLTVRSRVQEMVILPPDRSDLTSYFAPHHDETKIAQAYMLSGGLPGLMTVLLAQDQDHPLFQAVAHAKFVLTQDKFNRMSLVDTLSKQKQDAKLFCEALVRIAQTAIVQAAAQEEPAKIKRWHHIMSEAQAARTDMQANAHTKLCLTKLFLSI